MIAAAFEAVKDALTIDSHNGPGAGNRPWRAACSSMFAGGGGSGGGGGGIGGGDRGDGEDGDSGCGSGGEGGGGGVRGGVRGESCAHPKSTPASRPTPAGPAQPRQV